MHIIHNLSGQHNDLMIVDILFHIIFFLNGEFNGFFVGAGILCKSFLGSYAHYPQNCPHSSAPLHAKGMGGIKPGKSREGEWAGMKNGTKRVVDINRGNSKQHPKKSRQYRQSALSGDMVA